MIPTVLNCDQATLDAIASNPNLAHLVEEVNSAQDIINILEECKQTIDYHQTAINTLTQLVMELDYALSLSNPKTIVLSNEEFRNYFKK